MELAEVVGHLAALRRFPVEPLAGESPDTALLRDGGLFGDRVFELSDEKTGQPVEAAAAPVLLSYTARYMEDLVAEELDRWTRVRNPAGRDFSITDPEWVSEVSQRLGRPVALKRRETISPIRLISRPTLRLAERTYGASLEQMRLRANLFVEITEGKAFDEDKWIGQSLRIGDAFLEITRASTGCLLMIPSEASSGDVDMLRGLLGMHGHLGVDLRAVGGARIRVGDPVVLVD
jgi:uncharacterized protein